MEREIMRGPLSRQSAFRLFMTGPCGTKEIERVVRVLELQKQILQESEADDANATLSRG